MNIQDFIKLSSRKVRGDSNLMAFYIDTFFSIFGYKPNCVGCTFNNDFKKLKTELSKKIYSNKNEIIMSTTEKTFKLKKVSNRILTYKVAGRPYRMYDNRLTEDFAIAYLTNGSKKEIEERKSFFSVLPEAISSKASKSKKEDNKKDDAKDEPEITETQGNLSDLTQASEKTDMPVLKTRKKRQPKSKK